jgi:putative transposase
MKASGFSESQIAYVVRQSEEGTAIGEVCRSAGILEATFYNWRKKYGGLPSEMKRLKLMEEESSKLRKLVADAGQWARLGSTEPRSRCIETLTAVYQ